jgi:hypothetical protein
MGRYYYGMITGKFWFGIQSSNDAEEFGGVASKVYEYECCHCCAEIDIIINKNYCCGCYDSFEEHLSAAIDDGQIDEGSKDKPNVLITETDTIDISFEAGQLEEVQKHIAEYEKVVLPLIKKFTMNKDENYEYDYELVDEPIIMSKSGLTFVDKSEKTIPEETLALIARWCLAKQVEQCLIDEGSCSFNCEC